MRFGIGVAKKLLTEVGAGNHKVKLFCEVAIDLFSTKNMSATFGFYIASFSRKLDDIYQWQKYGQAGQGFAISLAPKLFAVENKPDRRPHENIFVSPVSYGARMAAEFS